MNIGNSVNLQEQAEKARAVTDTKKYYNGDPIDRDDAVNTLGKEVDTLLTSKVAPGEYVIIHGSTARALLHQILPIYFSRLTTEEQSDRDILVVGEKTKRNINPDTTAEQYLLERGEVGEATKIRYEFVDGLKIREETIRTVQDIQAQIAKGFPSNERPYAVQMVADRADVFLNMCRSNIDATVLAENLLPELQVGIKATNVDGRMEYTVCDPFKVLPGIYKQFETQKALFGISAGVMSDELPYRSIHSLVMDTTLLFGKIETDSFIPMHTVACVMKMMSDELSGVQLASDGLTRAGIISLAQAEKIPSEALMFALRRYEPLYSGIDDFAQIRNFLEHIKRFPDFTNVTPAMLENYKHLESHEELITVTAQRSFAKAASADVETAIFEAFSYLNIGNYINALFDHSLQDYHMHFDMIPQNTLKIYLKNKLGEMLPEQYLAGAQGLKVLENVMDICRVLYPRVLSYSYTQAEAGGDKLPVIAPGNLPQSMSEVFAVMLVATGEPFQREAVMNMVKAWRLEGRQQSFFNNIPVDFNLGISLEDIEKEYYRISELVTLSNPSVFSSFTPAPFAT